MIKRTLSTFADWLLDSDQKPRARVDVPATFLYETRVLDHRARSQINRNGRGDAFAPLGDDIVLHIFSFLPARSLVNIQRVSNGWYQLSSAPSLWNSLVVGQEKTDESGVYKLVQLLDRENKVLEHTRCRLERIRTARQSTALYFSITPGRKNKLSTLAESHADGTSKLLRLRTLFVCSRHFPQCMRTKDQLFILARPANISADAPTRIIVWGPDQRRSVEQARDHQLFFSCQAEKKFPMSRPLWELSKKKKSRGKLCVFYFFTEDKEWGLGFEVGEGEFHAQWSMKRLVQVCCRSKSGKGS